jgi:hypothetical protein
MDLSTGTAIADGWHIQGSAIDYYQASAPTTRPDGMTALDASDYGRRWYNTSTGVESIYTVGGWGVFANTNWQGQIVRITSGSGNWTVPGGVHKIRVKCVGGGGGGCGGDLGSAVSSGGNGNATTFAGATTGPGGGGAAQNLGGAAPATPAGEPGCNGLYFYGAGGSAVLNSGGQGGGSTGGRGGLTGTVAAAGGFGGGGGGGGGGLSTGTVIGGGGGGGTSICDLLGDMLTVAPGDVIAYSVGAGGAGSAGTNGQQAGADGGSGIIIIEY